MSDSRAHPLRLALELIAVALAYAAAGLGGMEFAVPGSKISLIWPPTGIAVAAILWRGPRMVWAVIAGAAAMHFWIGSPPMLGIPIAAGGGLGTWLAAELLRRRGFAPSMERRRDVVLLVAAAGLGMLVPATVGISSLLAFGMIPAGVAAQAWMWWWVGDVLGVLVLGAALITWRVPAARRPPRLEIILQGGLTLGVAAVFVLSAIPIGFIVAAPLMWTGLRMAPRHTARTLLVIAGFAVYGATIGHGPFVRATPHETFVYLSAYLATMAELALFFGAVIAEWRRAHDLRDAAEERRVAALVAGSLGTFDWDLATGKLRCDEGYLALFGVREFDGTLESIAERVHPGDLPRFGAAIDRARVERQPFRFEYRVHAPDGGWRWLESRGHHVFDAAGTVIGLTGVVQDVNARKTAELALVEAHERLRLALEHGRMGIWDTEIGDPQRRAELLALFEEEDRPAAAAALERSLAGEPFRVELRVRVEDGTPRWRSIYGAPHQTAEGGVRLLGVVHDITERVGIEVRLRRDAEALEAINRCQSELLGGRDPQVSFDRLIAAVLEVTGSERGVFAEVLEGSRLRTFASAGLTVEEIAAASAPVLAGHGMLIEPPPRSLLVVPLQHGHRTVGILALAGRREGYAGAMSRDLEPVLATGGYLIASWRERLRREKAEAQLREEQARSAGIIAAALDGIVTADEDGMIVDANPAAERIFGCGVSELRGMPLVCFLPHAPRQPARATAISGVRKDGAAVPLEAAITGVALGGEKLLTYTLRDVTERRNAEETRARLERQLREAQKMEAIGTLAGGIAHDFNNILGAVLGNVDLMRHDIDEQHPAYESLVEVRQASLRARDLVRQILAFSRRSESPRRAMSIRPVIEEAVRLMRASLPRAVRIETSVDAATPPVIADASQLHQVVLNLGTNAFQALPKKDGRIDVTLEAVRVPASLAAGHPDLRAGRWVKLSVRDNGCGMDAATRERIFEPFFTTKPPGEGTGLGLAVVHGIVKAHGGAVLVDSEVGKGTTFSVYLPVARHAVKEVEDSAQVTMRGRGERVLFVDDEPALVAIGVRTLSHLGYEVTGAASPGAALDAVKADPARFAAVVTDLTMPGMTGLELGVELLKVRPGLPLILVSGYGGGTGPDSAIELGFKDMIAKPASTEILADALRRAIDGLPRNPSSASTPVITA